MRSGFTHNYAQRYVERFTVTRCSERLVTTRTAYRYACEKTSAPVFFTLRRLNCPRTKTEKRGTTRVKTVEWERSVALTLLVVEPACSYSLFPRKAQTLPALPVSSRSRTSFRETRVTGQWNKMALSDDKQHHLYSAGRGPSRNMGCFPSKVQERPSVKAAPPSPQRRGRRGWGGGGGVMVRCFHTWNRKVNL